MLKIDLSGDGRPLTLSRCFVSLSPGIGNARLHNNREQVHRLRQFNQTAEGLNREQPPRTRQYNQPPDALKGGPPCPDFNSQKGCNFPSGHLVQGKRFMHICSFCLMNSAATYPHAEVVCRNKTKVSRAHFQ